MCEFSTFKRSLFVNGAIGLLASAMDIQDVATSHKDTNVALLGLLILFVCLSYSGMSKMNS